MTGSPLQKKVMLMVMPLFSQVRNGCRNAWTSRRKRSKESEGSTEPLPSSKGDEHRQVIETPEGQLTITFTPKKKEESFDRKQPQAFGHGYSIGGASEFNLEPVTNGDHLCQ